MNKRLYRSRKEKMIGGVAGGLAEYFEIDPVIVRLGFVLLFFAGGIAFLAYIVCMVVIPKEPLLPPVYTPTQPQDQEAPQPVQQDSEQSQEISPRKKIFGIILVLAGILLFAHNVLPFCWHIDFIPIVFILLGVWLILSNHPKGNQQ
jgi:phage shock protein PspC (stress-responsive transcriptional regulator)